MKSKITKTLSIFFIITIGSPVSAEIEEVIVTAAKREQSLQEVPIAVSVIDGETIEKCKDLHLEMNVESPLPFKICLDVDHGDVSSLNPDDNNPYKWLETFCEESPVIHLKQSSNNKSGHWPFTKEHNREGKIKPTLILDILKAKKANKS